jgi:putative oxidoreductase
MRKFLFLAPAQGLGDFTLLLLRLFVGLFLIWGVWDNVGSAARMQEFADFLAQHGFKSPRLMALLSVYLQLAIGLGFVLGLFTRWAGILCAVHFAIAIIMVDRHGGMRGVFPSGCLVFIGLYLGTYGAGRFSLDAALRANEVPRASMGSVRLKK